MHTLPILTGDPRTDRALLTLARLLAEIAETTRTNSPPPTPTNQDKRDGE